MASVGQLTKEQKALAQRAYETALANISRQRGQLGQYYGMQFDTNQKGESSNFRVDPNNPYGAWQRMLTGISRDYTGADYAKRARGFRGAGLGNQMASRMRYDSTGKQLDFNREMQDKFDTLYRSRQQAEYDLNYAQLQADLAYAMWQAGQVVPGAPAGNNGGSVGATTTTPRAANYGSQLAQKYPQYGPPDPYTYNLPAKKKPVDPSISRQRLGLW